MEENIECYLRAGKKASDWLVSNQREDGCGAGKLTFEPAVTHRFRIDDAVEALCTADGSKCGKVLFAWD